MTQPSFGTTAIACAAALATCISGCGASANGPVHSDASVDLEGGGPDAGMDAVPFVPPTDSAASEAAPSNADAALTDAGAFPCGDALCEPSQICLTPAYGCVAGPPSDAGTCPVGTTYDDASDRCVQIPPAPSCVSPTPGEGSFDCSEVGGDPSCSVVNAPIPSSCSHACRAICA